ncbi:hypothetical protein BLA29_000540 [Euroglyphus maynei]|uniref:Small ribosomal subunit protein mS33 n=1 Tax=Euroglyphus maynei TaxID=6958 RepID=A0A1Y3BPP6_EURMA|nr:hypothetical protein BLA29_000540 [Euroglyphus maynei]
MGQYMGDFAKLIPRKHVSKYALRMMKLRSKLFNEYVRTPMPYEISRAVLVDPRQRQAWDSHHFQNEQMVNRFSQLPSDLDHIRSIRYYPAHPQIGNLMTLLRQHGLYRDEHKDIQEEMSRLRALRGKPDKVWGKKKSQAESVDEE